MGCSSKTTIELSIPFPPCDDLSSPCSSAIFLLTCSLVGSYSLSSLHKLPPANNSKSSQKLQVNVVSCLLHSPQTWRFHSCWTHFPPQGRWSASINQKRTGGMNNTPKYSGKWILVIPSGESFRYHWYNWYIYQTQATSRWFLFLPKSTESKPATTCISWGFRSCCFVVTTSIVPGPKKNEELERQKVGPWCIQITQQKRWMAFLALLGFAVEGICKLLNTLFPKSVSNIQA